MKPINVGVVGLGRLGTIHAGNIALRIPHAKLSALCARSPHKLDDARKKWGVKHTFTDYDGNVLIKT